MLMRGSTRSPALLIQFISEENTHNSYPGVCKPCVRCEASGRGKAAQFRSHLRRVPAGSNDEPRWQVYFSYCATCLWSVESLQKLQWSERSEFGVQWASRVTIESMEANRGSIPPSLSLCNTNFRCIKTLITKKPPLLFTRVLKFAFRFMPLSL